MRQLDPAGYWFDTDRRVAIENHRDRLAARALNAANLLRDREPFGTSPVPSSDNPRLSA